MTRGARALAATLALGGAPFACGGPPEAPCPDRPAEGLDALALCLGASRDLSASATNWRARGAAALTCKGPDEGCRAARRVEAEAQAYELDAAVTEAEQAGADLRLALEHAFFCANARDLACPSYSDDELRRLRRNAARAASRLAAEAKKVGSAP